MPRSNQNELLIKTGLYEFFISLFHQFFVYFRFNSPRHPSNYPSSTDCIYEFYALPHEQVQIVFDSFKVRVENLINAGKGEVQWPILATLQIKSCSGSCNKILILRPFSKTAEKTRSCFALDNTGLSQCSTCAE